MPRPFQCNIVTAEDQLFSGSITQIIVPGAYGEFGVLAGHSPVLAQLKTGVIRLEPEDPEVSNRVFFVSGGFVEVVPHCTTVLAEKALRAKDIDEAAAQEAKRHAEQLMTHKQSEVEYSRAISQLSEAIAQLRTLAELRKLLRK